MTAPEFPELGFYGLAGHSDNPGDLIDEVRQAEELGLGSVFLSERFNYKDAAVMAGMAAAASSRIGIATAATNHNTRHPLITATMAATMHRASGGRFALGLGRGFAPLFDLMGVPRITNAQLTDVVEIYRRLWRGEQFGHSGPAGEYPYLFTVSPLEERIPILMVSIGPKSMQLAGRIADAVVLHTYMPDEAVARSVELIRRSAEEAGRDPASVRIWACTAVIDDAIDEQTRLRKTVGRLATYLQGYGDTLISANGWDPAPLRHVPAGPDGHRRRGRVRHRGEGRGPGVPAGQGDPGRVAGRGDHRRRTFVRRAGGRPTSCHRRRQRDHARRHPGPAGRRRRRVPHAPPGLDAGPAGEPGLDRPAGLRPAQNLHESSPKPGRPRF